MFVARLAVLAGLAAMSVAAGARTLSDDEAMALSLEGLLAVQVLSTEQYVRQLSGAASTTSVVTAADIRDHGYRNLADVLKSLPGLYVTYDRNDSYLGSRGFGKVGDWNSRILVLVDGNRVNENVYDGAYIGNDFIVDVALIDRVEFVAGPAAAMVYGNNAFFGVVNVVTKSGRKLNGGEIDASAASARTGSLRASYGRRTEQGLEFLLSASRYDSEGRAIEVPEFGRTSEGRDDERTDRLFAKFAKGGLSLNIAHRERSKGVPNAPYQQVFNDPRSRMIDEQTYVDLGYEKSIGDGATVSGRLYYGRYDFVGDYVYDLATAPPPDIVVQRETDRGRWWGADARSVATLSGGHRLLLGAEYQINTARDQAVGNLGQAALLDDRRRDRFWSIYAHDEVAVGDRLTVDAGARYDQPTVGSGEIHPRLGAIFRWRPETVTKLLYGEAFRPPNVYELYYDVADGNRPNPNLEPERIRTLEAVLEQRVSDAASWTASLFRNEISGLINYAPVAGIDGIVGTSDDEAMFANLSRVRTTGLELVYDHALARGGKLNISYTLQRTRDLDGRVVENSPRHLAKLNWRQALFDTGWRFGLETHYVGVRDNYAGRRVASRTGVNLALSTTVLQNLDLSLRVANLFNRDLSDPAPDFHAPLDRITQDGRIVRAGAVYRF